MGLPKDAKNKMYIPESIKAIAGAQNFEADKTGLSSSSVLLSDEYVLKISDIDDESENEIGVMKWLKGKISVPEVIHHEKYMGKNYLLMSKIYGTMACDRSCLADPLKLICILAEGLKALWDVDVSQCPYNQSLEKRLRAARYNVEHGLVDIDDAEPHTYGENGFKDPVDLLNWLINNKPNEDFVLSHGDFCLPNIFIKDGNISGFIDLGKTGYADKYQDIALCCRSLKRNLEEDFAGKANERFNADIFFNKLNIEPDWNKIRYYILLDELF